MGPSPLGCLPPLLANSWVQQLTSKAKATWQQDLKYISICLYILAVVSLVVWSRVLFMLVDSNMKIRLTHKNKQMNHGIAGLKSWEFVSLTPHPRISVAARWLLLCHPQCTVRKVPECRELSKAKHHGTPNTCCTFTMKKSPCHVDIIIWTETVNSWMRGLNYNEISIKQQSVQLSSVEDTRPN